mgnify:FL=1
MEPPALSEQRRFSERELAAVRLVSVASLQVAQACLVMIYPISPGVYITTKGDAHMANVISDETIEYVGILAKLELSDEEKEAAKKDMASMLDYIDKLGELDTTGVEPMSHVFPVNNVMREDVVTNGDGSEATLANAPECNESGFIVPKTVES